MQPANPSLVPPKERITGSFSEGADLISSIVAGLVVGLVLDWLLGTRPLMVVIWIVLGIGVGFWKLWKGSATLEEQAKERGYGV